MQHGAQNSQAPCLSSYREQIRRLWEPEQIGFPCESVVISGFLVADLSTMEPTSSCWICQESLKELHKVSEELYLE